MISAGASFNYMDYDSFYQPYYLDAERQKRSAQDEVPMTAENMMAEAPQRSKRDLTDGELQDWLEQENSLVPSEGYAEEYGEENPEELTENQESLMERILEAVEGDRWDKDPEEEEFEEEAYFPLSEQEAANSELEDKAKLALLQYLYDEMPDEVNESEEYEDPYKSDDQELDYEPIVYRGVPGIFIPVQKQPVYPAVRKRASDFYPYSYESSPSGRWGAFLPDKSEEKRNAEAYDRLYRMASALKRYDDDWL